MASLQSTVQPMIQVLLLIALTLARVAHAAAPCFPSSLEGHWEATGRLKWMSCLPARCKHGTESRSVDVDAYTFPSDIVDRLSVQCWPDASSLWSAGIGPYVSLGPSRGGRCTVHVEDAQGLERDLQSCADASLRFLSLASSVQSKHGGRKLVTTATLRFSLANPAGRVIVRTTVRQLFTREDAP